MKVTVKRKNEPQKLKIFTPFIKLDNALKLANLGAEEACRRDPALMKGLNTYRGHVTYKAVAVDQGLEYVDPTTLF